MSTNLSPVVLLLIAAAVGALLGLPRWKQPGGMHTHMLVSVGAALFCLTGTQVNADHKEYLRIIQGVASGVGFVGAASVLREGMSVRGINMAASIWTTAAVGCEVGFGEHLMALVLAPIVAALNAAFYLLDSKLLEEPRREAEHKEQAKA